MSKKVKHLSLKITYKVGYGKVKMPKQVYEQLKRAEMKADPIEMHKYPEAAEWMSSNVRESDCFDWEAEIEDMS